MCVENKMANNGPMWVLHGLKFQCRTHIGPIWALCPDSAHMGPILPSLLGRHRYSLFTLFYFLEPNIKLKFWVVFFFLHIQI